LIIWIKCTLYFYSCIFYFLKYYCPPQDVKSTLIQYMKNSMNSPHLLVKCFVMGWCKLVYSLRINQIKNFHIALILKIQWKYFLNYFVCFNLILIRIFNFILFKIILCTYDQHRMLIVNIFSILKKKLFN